MKSIFEDLFVLELANNHWGKIERGMMIVEKFSHVARNNQVKAAIKLQFRQVENFIHPRYKGDSSLRYIKKTEDTRLSTAELGQLIRAIDANGCIPMATPFDEASVKLCDDFDLPIIKLASSDIDDWYLIERIAATRRPVIASTGGASLETIDKLVEYFDRLNIAFSINHCVSVYPSEDDELELNQIDFLKYRYPHLVIGFSTHEYHDWHSSMLISYAKGARSWERHIDINADNISVSPYCSLPDQVDHWFKSYHLAKLMCGGPVGVRRNIPAHESEYLNGLLRGVYAKRDLPAGYIFDTDSLARDFYLAIPLIDGQVSCRAGMDGARLVNSVDADMPICFEGVEIGSPVRSLINPDFVKG